MFNLSCTRRLLYALLPLLFVLLAPAPAHAVPVVALVDFNRLVLFDSSSPGTIISSGLVTGTVPGDRIIAIDFRPTTGQLYGFSTGDFLYVIDPQTRAVIRTLGPISPTVNGNAIAFDFDPARDRLRVVNDDTGPRQNFLVDPDPATGGGMTVETPPAFAPGDQNAPQTPVIHGLAYDNNFLGAAHSRLWGIHRGTGINVPYLVTIAPGGQIRTVGPLLGTGEAAHVTNDIGFDIAPVSGAAFVVLKMNSPTITATHLYEVNLATGSATSLGVVGEPGQVLDIAVVPPPLIVYAVNEQNELIKFNSATPSNIISRVPITGLLDGEQIYDIDFWPTTDFRPGREELYGVGRTGSGATATSSHLYVINPETGVAAPPSVTNPLSPALTGVPSLDFNPANDRIRIVTSAGQNLLADPGLGQVVATATPLAYAPGDPNAGRDSNVLAAAHSNNFPGATSTTLYVIDRDQPGSGAHLSRVGEAGGGPLAANSGRMFTVAQSVGFGVPVDDIGFDIAPGFEGAGLLSTISMDEAFSRLSVLGVTRAGGGHVGPVGSAGALERLRDLAVAPTATLRFETDLTQVVEDCTSVSVNVVREGDTSNEATVDYATASLAGPVNQRRNFTAARGTLHFAAGQTSAAIKVLISEDAHLEKGTDHGVPFNGTDFELTLTNPSNGHTLGDAAKRLTHVHILDDEDTGAEPNPVNDSHTFVCQHYHDFLGREPDAAGLAFWINNIESCGTDAQCREVKRIDTSAAFFLSIEFQETGFLAYRTYAAAFGPARVGGTVPLTLEEFLFDAGRVARGVVVGPGEWQARLENNRRAYFDEFVQRPAFEAVYPRAMSAAAFVDALNANTSNSLTPAERDALVSGLGTGAETRATALRKVVENDAFRRRELNRAFVLAQYFGYLRRNPDEFPDADFSGYNFWLAKLNQFGGDFRRAEMVKAFINSTEYRSRFGTP